MQVGLLNSLWQISNQKRKYNKNEKESEEKQEVLPLETDNPNNEEKETVEKQGETEDPNKSHYNYIRQHLAVRYDPGFVF